MKKGWEIQQSVGSVQHPPGPRAEPPGTASMSEGWAAAEDDKQEEHRADDISVEK